MNDPRPVADVPERITFENLLRLCKGTGTWAQLADRMPINPETGRHSPGWKRLEQIANSGLGEMPNKSTIKNLAVGLDVSEQTVVDACCESLGIAVTRRNARVEATLIVPGVEDLPDATLAAFRALLVAQVKANRQSSG